MRNLYALVTKTNEIIEETYFNDPGANWPFNQETPPERSAPDGRRWLRVEQIGEDRLKTFDYRFQIREPNSYDFKEDYIVSTIIVRDKTADELAKDKSKIEDEAVKLIVALRLLSKRPSLPKPQILGLVRSAVSLEAGAR